MFFKLSTLNLNRNLLFAGAIICFSFAALTNITNVAHANTAQDVKEHLAAARQYSKSEQWDYASFEYRAVLQQSPKNVMAIVGLADALVKGGYTKDAIRHLNEYEKRVKHIQIDLAFAKAWLALKKLDKAFYCYEAAMKKNPYDEAAYLGVLKNVKALPSKRKQKAYFKKFKNHALKSQKKGKLAIKRKDYRSASRYYGVLAIYQKKPEIINDYGVLLMLDGQYTKAYSQFKKIIGDFENWKLYANSAVADLSLDKTYGAKIKIEAALALVESPEEKSKLYNILGYVFEQSGNGSGAQVAYEKAIELNPSNIQATENLAYVYQREQFLDKAADTYKSLLRSVSKNADNAAEKRAEYKTNQGFVYELMYKTKPAIAAYKKAIAYDASYKPAYENLSILYRKMGKDEKAAEIYKQMMEIQFDKMEKRDLKAKKKPRTKKSAKIVDYVDLFFLN